VEIPNRGQQPQSFSFNQNAASGIPNQGPPPAERRHVPPQGNPLSSNPPKKALNEKKKNSSKFENFKMRRAERKRKQRLAKEAWKQSGVAWRVFPRTLLGIMVSLLMFAVGAGISGAVLFAYYESRVTASENKILEFSSTLDQRVAEGVDAVEQSSSVAQERLSATLGPYTALLQSPDGLPQVVSPVAPSVALVESRSLDGKTTIGTATAVGNNGDGTYFLTGLEAVRAATASPGPEIVLRKGEGKWTASLVSWDEELEMALLVSDAPLQAAPFSPVEDLGILTGAPIFALSALNDSVSPGAVITVTRDGFRHTGVIDADFIGGPILDETGKIVGFATRDYSPDGIQGGRLPWAPTIPQLCKTLVSCENDAATPR
jgi:hypothetical protein